MGLDLVERVYSVIDGGGKITTKRLVTSASVDEDIVIQPEGDLIIGQEQPDIAGSFDSKRSFQGVLADLSVYHRKFNSKEMISWYNKIVAPNDYLFSFSKPTHFFANSVDIFSVNNNTDLFSIEIPYYLTFTEQRSFRSATLLCNSLGGTVALPRNAKENRELFEVTSNISQICEAQTGLQGVVWLGVIRENNEWEDYESKNLLSYTQFSRDSEYSGNEGISNCAVFQGCNISQKMKWYALECTDYRSVTCRLNKLTTFRLRGLCKKSLFDRQYILNDTANNLQFIGTSSSVINMMDANDDHPYGRWTISLTDLRNAHGVMSMFSPTHDGVGVNPWTITGDTCGTTETDLVLTACNLTQFTCSDGSCVDISGRCNFKEDCIDLSDESDCNTLVFPSNYNQEYPPTSNKFESHEEMRIKTQTEIPHLYSISLNNFEMICDLILTFEWVDFRLNYRNLKDHYRQNYVFNGDFVPWSPKYDIYGFNNSVIDKVLRSERLYVKKKSKPLNDDDQELLNGNVITKNYCLQIEILLTTYI